MVKISLEQFHFYFFITKEFISFIETRDRVDNSIEKLNQYVIELNTYFKDEDPYGG